MSRIYLETIVEKKRARVKALNYDINILKTQASKTKASPSFFDAMKKDGLSIIGEIKKASPSKGLIKPDFNPIEIAKEYQVAVDAISVLTEEEYFLGKDEYLKDVSSEVSLPTLCKDFIIHESQIYRAKILGASCVLLIVAILSKKEIIEFLKLANDLGLDALVEVHTKEELDIALECDAKIIGVNNRDLNTFKTDVRRTIELVKCIPSDKVIISESGIMGIDDIKILKVTKIDGILVGESFMRADDIIKHAKDIKDEYKS